MRSVAFLVAVLSSVSVSAGDWNFSAWEFSDTNGARPSAATGEGINLSPSPVFTLAVDATKGTEARFTSASDCADGTCFVGGNVAGAVRRVASVPRRVLARRPLRGLFGRVRCGIFGCR